MQFINGLHNLQTSSQERVVTIGNFDGVHLGHQAIFRQLNQQALQYDLKPLVVIFEPQPREFLVTKSVPARLTRLREKIIFMQQHGVQQILCLHFNQSLAQLSASDFVKRILLDKLHTRNLIVGEDFHFGAQRLGDFSLLQALGVEHHFNLIAAPTMMLGGLKVSSTHVREALQQANFELVASLLGRQYSLYGKVMRGEQRGRQWGVPTANLFLQRKVSPLQGVYAVTVAGLGTAAVAGVANVGTRPTFSGTRSLLEVHLFDFNRDIYGKHLEVKFWHKLREEQRFASLELLKQQIFQDIENARAYFKRHCCINKED